MRLEGRIGEGLGKQFGQSILEVGLGQISGDGALLVTQVWGGAAGIDHERLTGPLHPYLAGVTLAGLAQFRHLRERIAQGTRNPPLSLLAGTVGEHGTGGLHRRPHQLLRQVEFADPMGQPGEGLGIHSDLPDP